MTKIVAQRSNPTALAAALSWRQVSADPVGGIYAGWDPVQFQKVGGFAGGIRFVSGVFRDSRAMECTLSTLQEKTRNVDSRSVRSNRPLMEAVEGLNRFINSDDVFCEQFASWHDADCGPWDGRGTIMRTIAIQVMEGGKRGVRAYRALERVAQHAFRGANICLMQLRLNPDVMKMVLGSQAQAGSWA